MTCKPVWQMHRVVSQCSSNQANGSIFCTKLVYSFIFQFGYATKIMQAHSIAVLLLLTTRVVFKQRLPYREALFVSFAVGASAHCSAVSSLHSLE